MRAPGFWAIDPPTPLARALQPIGAAYGFIAGRRMARPGARVEAPVICVGNFVAGGAGKTPAAIAIARLLIASGEAVAFLSRGYGGSAGDEPVAVDPERHGASDVGDEPLLLARVAPTFVARDRPRAAKAAIAAGAGVLVLDDGLQNPALVKDFSIAMIDGGFGLGNGLCVPAGPLRAPIGAQAPHVSLVVATDSAAAPAARARAALVGTPFAAARLESDAGPTAQLRGKDVLAFAGIGRPEKFFATLQALGARIVAARAFPDHHRYGQGELDALLAVASGKGLIAVTTEKDWVRLPGTYAREVVALPVTLQFDDAPFVARLLAEALARRRAPA